MFIVTIKNLRTIFLQLLKHTINSSASVLSSRSLSIDRWSGDSKSQSQSHIATDTQSVCLSWCRTPSGAYDQKFVYLFLFRESYSLVYLGALSDERSGLSFVSQSSVIVSIYIYTMYFQNITEIVLNIQYEQGLCLSRLSTADYALLLVAFATTAF
jgi:hypothetical protein